jgi:hypothetical protein
MIIATNTIRSWPWESSTQELASLLYQPMEMREAGYPELYMPLEWKFVNPIYGVPRMVELFD